MSGLVPRERLIWIDWMKSIGMLLVIWGHCFPEVMSGFIYAFNVPVFFVVAGYLTKHEQSTRVFFSKILNGLVVPYFILAIIKAAGYIFNHLDDGQWLWSIFAIVAGFHQLHDAAGCSNLWFVYTLIIIKVIFQFFPDRRALLSFLAILCALVYNHFDLNQPWSVTNVMLALPFFMLGNYCTDIRSVGKTGMLKRWHYLVIVSLCAVVVFLIGCYNGPAYMFKCSYGESFLLFSVASVAGCVMVYLISMLLNKYDWRIVRVSSVGTIVTLVFHRELFHEPLKWIDAQNFSVLIENVFMFLLSVIVLLAFVPIILLVKRFIPIVLGRRAKSV